MVISGVVSQLYDAKSRKEFFPMALVTFLFAINVFLSTSAPQLACKNPSWIVTSFLSEKELETLRGFATCSLSGGAFRQKATTSSFPWRWNGAATRVESTTLPHIDRQVDGSPHLGDTVLVFLNSNSDANFIMDNISVPVIAGNMVQFPSRITHHTDVRRGMVELLGPFSAENLESWHPCHSRRPPDRTQQNRGRSHRRCITERERTGHSRGFCDFVGLGRSGRTLLEAVVRKIYQCLSPTSMPSRRNPSLDESAIIDIVSTSLKMPKEGKDRGMVQAPVENHHY
eukprot:g76237.t1